MPHFKKKYVIGFYQHISKQIGGQLAFGQSDFEYLTAYKDSEHYSSPEPPGNAPWLSAFGEGAGGDCGLASTEPP